MFATNGGMYQADRSPLGLHVENGRELIRANTAVGTGNFYIRPNGIFYVNGDSASILETRHFLQQRPYSCLLYTSLIAARVDSDDRP